MTRDIATLRSLLAAATPAPWRVENETYVLGPDEENVPRGYNNKQYAADCFGEANAALISAAINALPELLAIAEAALAYTDGPHHIAPCTCATEFHDSESATCPQGVAERAFYAAVDAARQAAP